jgi:hypothetical protein
MTQIDDVLKIICCIFLATLILDIWIFQLLIIIKYCRKTSAINDLTISDQQTISHVSIKLLEIVSAAVTGYYGCFTTCWNKTLESLTTIILAYITFLTALCKDLLSWPASIILSISAVFIVSIIPIIFYVLEYKIIKS